MIFSCTPAINRMAGLSSLMTPQQVRWAAALALPLILGPAWCLLWMGHPTWLGTLAGFVMLVLLATCAVTDFRQHKIYNWATYSAFVWALAINLAAATFSSSEGVLNHAYSRANSMELLGAVGITECLAGAALCFLITMVGYHLSGRGAGDVKLATAIGALLGIHHGVHAVFYSYIVAAVAIVLWSVWTTGPWALARAFGRAMGALLGPLWPFPPTTADSALLLRPIPLGPYFAIGTLLVTLEMVPV